MTYNENWIRWIETSVTYHMTSGFQARGILVKFGSEPANFSSNDKYVEVLLDGPKVREVAKDDYRIFLNIMVLVEYKVTAGLYESADAVGIAIGLLRAIPIYRNGDVSDQLGCLVSDAPTTRDWSGKDQGVNDTQTAIHQRSIEAELMMEL